MPKTPLNNFDLNLAKTLRRCWSYRKSFISVNFFKFFCCLSVCKMATTEFPSFSSCHNYPWGLQYTLFSSYSDKAIGYTYLYCAVMQSNASLYIWNSHWVWSSNSLRRTMWLIKHKYLTPHLPQHPNCNKMKLCEHWKTNQGSTTGSMMICQLMTV